MDLWFEMLGTISMADFVAGRRAAASFCAAFSPCATFVSSPSFLPFMRTASRSVGGWPPPRSFATQKG